MSKPQQILVIGAGELGAQVIQALVQHPLRTTAHISVLLRPSSITPPDRDRAQELSHLRIQGVKYIPADIALDTESHLTSIFRTFDTVVGCTGFSAGRGMQVKIARAVLAAKVPRYIPWQFGVNYDAIGRGSAQDLFDEQLDVRDMLRCAAGTSDSGDNHSKTQWVIISTGMFTSFLFEPSFGVVDILNRRVTALGHQDNQVSVTAVEDIGRVTAEVVLGPESDSAFDNKVIYVAGDTLTYAKLGDLVESLVPGKSRIERNVKTVQEARGDLAREPNNTLFKYQVVFGEGRGVAWDLAETWNRKVGIKTMTVEEWARTHSLV
ncbi:hypothetical protein AFCA_003244 [Aspergillus flavus]|uniref:Isoflavone reductase family protein n=1 Tax=Aspergillus flavus TaxID=5059 RepID=A0AB74CLW7_ASPFL|nr:isoflavone reductase family protein [Aspergillus flavus]UDD55644.1 hypothetical protein AFCA_003244 [Aspergillus flavus]